MHLRVALTTVVLGRAGCRNQGGIDHAATLEHQAVRAEFVVDDLQDTWAQVIRFEQVAKVQDADPIRDSVIAAQAHKITVVHHLKQGFFGSKLRQSKPLL